MSALRRYSPYSRSGNRKFHSTHCCNFSQNSPQAFALFIFFRIPIRTIPSLILHLLGETHSNVPGDRNKYLLITSLSLTHYLSESKNIMPNNE